MTRQGFFKKKKYCCKRHSMNKCVSIVLPLKTIIYLILYSYIISFKSILLNYLFDQ